MGFAKGYAHVKTTIIALSAVALIAAAPAELVQDGSGRTPGLQHEVVKKHHASGHVRPREMQTMGAGKGYSGALGYAPGERSGYLDRDLEVSGRQAGGGGGGAACEPSRSDHLTSSELQTGAWTRPTNASPWNARQRLRPARICAARVERRRSGQEFARPRERYLSTISCTMMGFARGSTPIRAQTGRFGENRRWAARSQRDVIDPKPSKPCNELQSARLMRVEIRESEECHV